MIPGRGSRSVGDGDVVPSAIGLQIAGFRNLKEAFSFFEECMGNASGHICVDVADPELVKNQFRALLPFEGHGCCDVSNLPPLISDLNPFYERPGRFFGVISNLGGRMNTPSGGRQLSDEFCRATTIFKRQIGLSIYFPFSGAVIELAGTDLVQVANIVAGFLSGDSPLISNNYFRYWIKLPVSPIKASGGGKDDVSDKPWDPWKAWKIFWGLCDHDRRVYPVLELNETVPTAEEVERWASEPIQAIFVSSRLFQKNGDNQLYQFVLGTAHQQIIEKFREKSVHVMIEANQGSKSDLKLYKDHIEHLLKRRLIEPSNDGDEKAKIQEEQEVTGYPVPDYSTEID